MYPLKKICLVDSILKNLCLKFLKCSKYYQLNKGYRSVSYLLSKSLASGGGVPLVLEVDLLLRSSGCSVWLGDEDAGAFSPTSGSLHQENKAQFIYKIKEERKISISLGNNHYLYFNM